MSHFTLNIKHSIPVANRMARPSPEAAHSLKKASATATHKINGVIKFIAPIFALYK